MHKDEIWQLFYPNGEPIAGVGWPAVKNNPKGEDIEIVGLAIAFLYRYNKDGDIEFLWQKRSEKIDRYPGDWDLSAGGHVNLGETVVEATVREAREEIGAVIEKEELQFVTMRPFNKNRFAWVYLVNYTNKDDDFHFDDEEVTEVKWVKLDEMDAFRREYAKAPLRKDELTFELIKEWLKMH